MKLFEKTFGNTKTKQTIGFLFKASPQTNVYGEWLQNRVNFTVGCFKSISNVLMALFVRYLVASRP